MDLTAAALLAMALSFVVYATAAVWYAVPRLRALPLGAALAPFLWIHAFRHIALQLFSSQEFGFAIPNSVRDQIAYGDLIGMLLALATLYAIKFGRRLAVPLAWVFVVASAIDLANAALRGIGEELFARAADVSWLILTFYVPALWVSLTLVVWILLTRRSQPEERSRLT
ncbi:MAG: hypothetical protein ACRDH6_09885 [Actinomycetota bacterium]